MRVTKPKEAHHVFRATSDSNGGECFLVKGGKRTYLWVGPISGAPPVAERVLTFSGPIGLRALAKAILKEVGRNE